MILICLLFLCIGCAKFQKVKLNYKVKFSLPINQDSGSIKILKTSNYFFEIPSSYFIYDSNLYIVDKFNNRIMGYDDDDTVLVISNRSAVQLTPVHAGSNRILQPFINNASLFSFHELGSVWVNKDAVFVESIIDSKEEEGLKHSYSFILKYNKEGKPLQAFGLRRANNKVYPFFNIVKFTVDNKNNLFIYSKHDDNWQIFKLDQNGKVLFNFNSFILMQSNAFLSIKGEKAVIENIDNSYNGDFLILGIAYYKADVKYQKSIYYKYDINSKKIEKLFNINNESFHFVHLNNNDLLYFWETEQGKKHNENIIYRIYNLSGRLVIRYYIELNRQEKNWFNIRLQKEGLITGANIDDDKFNIVVWK